MKNLRFRIEEAKRLANFIGERIDGLEVDTEQRRKLSAALLSICLSHHAAVVSLYDQGRYASAFALVRSMIDALSRSFWVAFLATDQQLSGFIQGDDPMGSRSIIAEMERQEMLETGNLSAVLDSIWSTVCDFNHAGGRMVVRHLSEYEIAPSFKEEELIEVLVAANSWALGAACAFADLLNDNDLGQAFLTYPGE